MKYSIIAVVSVLISFHAQAEVRTSQNKTPTLSSKNSAGQHILAKPLLKQKPMTAQPDQLFENKHQSGLIRKLLEKNAIISGGGDAGGGNLLNGKPIESYSLDIKSSPEMKKALTVIKPLMNVAFHNLNSTLDFVVNNKTWYMVPVTLSTIPSSELGVSFPTSQGALQDFEEIWIDQNLFNSMSFNNRVLLIVHELFMGLKVFSFESYYQQCKTNKPFNNDCLKYKSAQDRKTLNVNLNDYQDIRNATSIVSKNFADLESGNYFRNLKRMESAIYDGGGFDSDFIKPSNSSIEIHDFTDLDIINALKNQKSVKGFPKFCNHQVVKDLGNHNYQMKAQVQSKIVLNVLNNTDVSLNVESIELASGKTIINNSYNYSIPKNSKHSLSLAIVLNTPVYVMNYFVGVTPVNGGSQAYGVIAIGVDADLNVNSLAFATLDSDLSGILTGKDALRCLEKDEFICSGVNCL